MSTNPQDPEFDNIILGIAKRLFNRTPRIAKCLSYTNYCVILSFDGAISDRVIKLANRNKWAVEAERYLYPKMKEHGLPVPEIEFTQMDDAERTEPFIVMPKFSDLTLDNLCAKDSEAARLACERSGQFINTLHEKFAEPFTTSLAVGDMWRQFEAIQKIMDRGPDLSYIQEREPKLSESIEGYLANFKTSSTRRLIHGGTHTDNILADKSGNICVIDFGESICMSSPLLDLCTLLASHDGWSIGTGHPAQRKAIIEGYGGLDANDIKELYYWEMRRHVHSLSCSLRDKLDYRRVAEHIMRIADGHSPLRVI